MKYVSIHGHCQYISYEKAGFGSPGRDAESPGG